MFIVRYRYSIIRIVLFWRVNASVMYVFGGLRPKIITSLEIFHIESEMP